MGNQRIPGKAFGLGVAALLLTGAVVVWLLRRWTNHDVSDPGVTL